MSVLNLSFLIPHILEKGTHLKKVIMKHWSATALMLWLKWSWALKKGLRNFPIRVWTSPDTPTVGYSQNEPGEEVGSLIPLSLSLSFSLSQKQLKLSQTAKEAAAMYEAFHCSEGPRGWVRTEKLARFVVTPKASGCKKRSRLPCLYCTGVSFDGMV